ncbi:MAG TPA: TRAP transporter substrate-binding protein, partial [Rhizobiales bacterium]|nr:TRAP transporter substrate-binding protein [Hyphomicrobiales bacterium]
TRAENITRINNGTVGVISGSFGGTYLRIASDLAAVLNDGENLRILPIVGQGSLQNIDDILYLKGIDVGIVQSDVLAYIKANNIHPNINSRINYIAKLFNQELHVVAGRGIRSLGDLAGRKVSLGVVGSGASITAPVVFETLGVAIQPVHFDPALALEKVKKGEIAAAVFVTGKPADSILSLKPEDGLHLLTVDYAKPLREAYLPASFTHLDYPGLVPKGVSVRTISVDTVLAVYKWTRKSRRYFKVERFIKAFFANRNALKQPPRHRKWREMSIAATVPGWERFAPAQRILEEVLKSRQETADSQ